MLEHADNPKPCRKRCTWYSADFLKLCCWRVWKWCRTCCYLKKTLAVIIAGKLARLDNRAARPLRRGGGD
ncbi:hypothetical protein KCP73_01640 [Salmonella enterica subsp. enterica]|nr:hypothetical protein KCP73_01640 [Salmonella enterica subsp. enterica]